MKNESSTTLSAILIGHRYQLSKKLGEGGMGSVYQAVDKLLNQKVALKRVKIAKIIASPQDTIDLSREVLAREFQVLASLHHPHIIKVLDFGFDSGRAHYTMSLLHEPKGIIEYATNLSQTEKITLLIQTLQALVYLHRHNILHRDLKPSNILVDAKKGLQVMDFGLAIEVTNTKQTTGTLAYMSPEAIKGEPANFQSDLYSLGVVAYELFAGKHPYELSNTPKLINDIVDIMPDRDQMPVSEPLKDIILRLLAKSPQDRQANASMVISELSQFLPAPIVEDDSMRESVLQSPKFVSRKTELTLLTQGLQDALSGIGSAWLIGGESGVGKSRLLEELRIRALVNGALVIREEYAAETTRPFHLWHTVLHHLSLLTPLGESDLQFITDFLANKHTASQTSRGHLNALASVIINIFKKQRTPIVLLIDNLHLAQESLLPLKMICKKIGDLKLLVIGTYRSDDHTYFYGKLPEMTPLEIKRFSQQEVEEVAVSIVGEVGKRHGIAEFLYAHTEGNAFFVIEALRSLAMKVGKLEDIGQITLPSSIFSHGMQDIVERRLARLSENHQMLLRYAAIIGKEIQFDLLTAILGKFDDNNLLLKCVDADIFRFIDGKWYFSHDKLREGIIHSLPDEQRQAMHQQIAHTIAQIYEPDHFEKQKDGHSNNGQI